MIKNTSNSAKRNALIGVSYSEPQNLLFVDYPGTTATCTGTFEVIKLSEASFLETDPENGAPVDQDISIIIRGQSKETDETIHDVTGKYLILKMTYLNGDVKIMGTPDCPVILISENSSNPTINTLSCKRTSPEKAKYLVV